MITILAVSTFTKLAAFHSFLEAFTVLLYASALGAIAATSVEDLISLCYYLILVFELGLESLRIPNKNLLSCLSPLMFKLMEVAAPIAVAISCACPTICEALTVELETLGLLAIARPVSVSLRPRRLLLLTRFALDSDPLIDSLLSFSFVKS